MKGLTSCILLIFMAVPASSFSTQRAVHQPTLARSHFGKTVLFAKPPPSSSSALNLSDAALPEKKGFLQKLKSAVPSKEERQKLIPLALMFFCILFNYTILRDTKDVLMVTAPKSGAEVIPFIKTYVNLPVAIVRSSMLGLALLVALPPSHAN